MDILKKEIGKSDPTNIWDFVAEMGKTAAALRSEMPASESFLNGVLFAVATFQEGATALADWKPGPLAEPIQDAEYELEFHNQEMTGSVYVLGTWRSGEFRYGPDPFDDYLEPEFAATAVRHRRIMPAPGEQS